MAATLEAMFDRRIWLAASLGLVGSSCTSNPPARSASAQQNAAAPSGPPSELPPALDKMMDHQPCQPRLQGPLEEHVLKSADGSGGHPFVIRAGEKLCLQGDSPTTLKLTDAVLGQDRKWVSAEFQMLDFGAVLVVRNQFDRPVRYRAILMSPNRAPAPTSICPVRPRLVGLEHWPYQVDAIAFGDFAWLEPGEAADCK